MTEEPRRLALITGASSGLGEAFAEAYAKRGCDLALVARRLDRLEALAERLRAQHGVEAYAIAQDLSAYGAETAVLERIAAEGRHVDVLVNNAGLSIAQDFAGVAWERQRDMLMTMVVSAAGLAHGVIPGMVERRFGRIIEVASIAAFAPGVAGHSLYPGVKSLGVKFSQSLDAELRGRGVNVTALCPGSTESEFLAANGTAGAGRSAGPLVMKPGDVVSFAIAANEAGKTVAIPGWHNRAAVFLMRALPEGIVRPLLMRGSQKYRLPNDEGRP